MDRAKIFNYNAWQLPIKAGWWDAPHALWKLTEISKCRRCGYLRNYIISSPWLLDSKLHSFFYQHYSGLISFIHILLVFTRVLSVFSFDQFCSTVFILLCYYIINTVYVNVLWNVYSLYHGRFYFKYRLFFRSSHRRFSVTKGVLKNFVKLTGKHLCQSLFFNKVGGLRPATLSKKRLWYRCFPVNFAKFLRTFQFKTFSTDEKWIFLT